MSRAPQLEQARGPSAAAIIDDNVQKRRRGPKLSLQKNTWYQIIGSVQMNDFCTLLSILSMAKLVFIKYYIGLLG